MYVHECRRCILIEGRSTHSNSSGRRKRRWLMSQVNNHVLIHLPLSLSRRPRPMVSSPPLIEDHGSLDPNDPGTFIGRVDPPRWAGSLPVAIGGETVGPPTPCFSCPPWYEEEPLFQLWVSPASLSCVFYMHPPKSINRRLFMTIMI